MTKFNISNRSRIMFYRVLIIDTACDKSQKKGISKIFHFEKLMTF